jgi:hypothetical protein
VTLRCECGGQVEITGQSDRDEVALEIYECVACGRTGTYRFGDGRDQTGGCLTSENEVIRGL